MITAVSIDHSPLLSFSHDNNVHGLWKFNSSLVHDEVYVESMGKLITEINTSDEMGIPKQNGNF